MTIDCIRWLASLEIIIIIIILIIICRIYSSQNSVYTEDTAGLQLREKEEVIDQLREEGSVRQQLLMDAQSHMHSLQASSCVNEYENDVSRN